MAIKINLDPRAKYWKIDTITSAKYCQPTDPNFLPRLESSRNICANITLKCIFELCGRCPDFKSKSDDHFERKQISDKTFKKASTPIKIKTKTKQLKKNKTKETVTDSPLRRYL